MKVKSHESKSALEIIPQVKSSKNSLSTIAEELLKTHNETKTHLIINISDFDSSIDVKNILSFIKLSNHYKHNKKSFVIIAPQIDVDKVPEEIAIVPSLNEAFDIIEMEDIERDLGF